jgi:phosphoribosyl 1,2-cyclic phosphodiesterase
VSTLSLCSFSSGSSGNSYLVKTKTAAILIDAGISAARILRELERTETKREDVKALFVTHEHHDHVSGARVLLNKLPEIEVCASRGTMEGLARRDAGRRRSFSADVSEGRKRIISPDEPVHAGDMAVQAFRTLHDAAEPYGYCISAGEKRVAIVTDTGIVTENILYHVMDADILVLEANHDTEVLRRGSYPHYLKQRILGEEGHLSNAQAANTLLRLLAERDKKRVVLLAHLSHENNSPVLAEQTVVKMLAQQGRYTGGGLYLGVLLRNEASLLYWI